MVSILPSVHFSDTRSLFVWACGSCLVKCMDFSSKLSIQGFYFFFKCTNVSHTKSLKMNF